MVLDEKFIFKRIFSLGSNILKVFWIVTVLAVPDSPMNIDGVLRSINFPNSHEYQTVSVVGTIILENAPSSGC